MAGEMRQLEQTPIGRAIIEGDGKRLRECLKSDEDVHYRDRKNNTYFHLLATTYRPYLFYVIVATKLDINAQNRDGNTALHVTALQDECAHVTDLMACGADPTIRNKDGKTAEDIATHSKYWHDLYKKYKPGLREAIREHDVERVAYLLRCWCSVEVVIYGKDMRQYAAALTYHNIVALIDQYRFSIMAAYGVLECNYKKLRYALTRPECDVNVLQEVEGAHAHHMLQHAIRQQKRRLVVMLVDAGADVTTYVKLAEYIQGPLYFSTLCHGVDHEITETVLSAGPDLKAKDEKGRSALIFVLDRTTGPRSVELVKRLLDMGVDIAMRDNTGCTGRDIALFYRRHDIVGAIDKHLVSFVKSSNVARLRQLAMDAYHDIFIEYQHRDTWIYAAGNETGETSNFLLTLKNYWDAAAQLHKVTVEGDQGKVEQLLQDADNREQLLLSRDKGGRSLLLKAIMYGHETLTRWLIGQHPGLLELKDNSYRTPLHYAYGLGDNARTIVDILVEAGVSAGSLDVTGKKPQDYSTEWLELEKKAVYGLQKEKDCVEKYELLLSIIQSKSRTLTDFDSVLKGLRCPVGRLHAVLHPRKHCLVANYRDLLLAAVDHGKDDIARKLVRLGTDCSIVEKYVDGADGCRWYNAEERARALGKIQLADYIKSNKKSKVK